MYIFLGGGVAKDAETKQISVLGSSHVVQLERGTSFSDQLVSPFQWFPHEP